MRLAVDRIGLSGDRVLGAVGDYPRIAGLIPQTSAGLPDLGSSD